MARIYNSESYGTQYRGSAQSVGFTPVVEASTERQVREWGEARVQDAQTMGRDLARKLQLEQQALTLSQGIERGQQQINQATERGSQAVAQTIERGQLNKTLAADKGNLELSQFRDSATMRMNQQYSNALSGLTSLQSSLSASVTASRTQAISGAIQGLLSLSSTYLKYADQQRIEGEKQKQIDAALDGIGLGTDFWTPVKTETPEATQQAQVQEQVIKSESTAINNAAQPLVESKNPVEVYAGEQLKQGTTWMQLGSIRGNVYAARSMFPIAYQEAITNGTIRPGADGFADSQKFLREFAVASGLAGADKKMVAEIFAPTALNTIQNGIYSVTKEHVEAVQAANQVTIKGRISDLADGATVQDVGKRFAQATDEAIHGNIGFNGKHSGKSNAFTLAEFLTNLRDEGKINEIKALRNHELVPGNKGTQLGKLYDHLFDAAENAAVDRQIENYSRQERLDTIDRKESVRFFFDDPSPENRQKAISILMNKGDEQSLKMAQELMTNGMEYDPTIAINFARLQSEKGILPSKRELDDLLKAGRINDTEYKFWSAKTPEALSSTALKPITDTLKSDLRKGMTQGKDLSPRATAEIGQRVDAAYEEITRTLNLNVANNPQLAKDPTALRQLALDLTSKTLSRAEYQPIYKDGEVTFGKPLALMRKIPQVSAGKEDFSSVSAENLFQGPGSPSYIPRSMMQPNQDIFVKASTLRNDIKALSEGRIGDISNRTRLLAKNLNLSPKAFIDAQMRAHGLPSYQSYLNNAGTAVLPQAESLTGAPTSLSQIGQQRTIQVGRHLLNQGYKIWQHPNFDLEKGFVPQGGSRVWQRPYDSGHNVGEALDFPLSHNSEQKLDRLYQYLNQNKQKFGIGQILWRSPGHHDHLHVEFLNR